MKKFTSTLIFIAIIIILSLVLLIRQGNNAFDETIYNQNLVEEHIKVLTSEEYFGRLTGTEGNEKALTYIENYFRDIGVEPAGINGTYYQEFSALIPDIDTDPTFVVKSKSNEILLEFDMYKDYKILTSMNGGGIDFSGDLLFVGTNLLRIDASLIKDRIVVISASVISQDKTDYVIQNGGKGLLCNTDDYVYYLTRDLELEKELAVSGKTGESLLLGYISGTRYKELLKLAIEVTGDEDIKPIGIVENAHIKVDIGFPIVDTANILGKIEGKSNSGRVLLITANVDGAGAGTDGKYFPGAISNTSGLAVMLETAHVLASQKNLPYETVVFIGFNGQKRQLSGSEYYLENPLYPINKTTIIHLEDIGVSTVEGLKISSDNINSDILKDKISNYAEDEGLVLEKMGPIYGVARRFADSKISAAVLSDEFFAQDNYDDVYQNADQEAIRNASMILLNYIKRDIFRDTGIDYLSIVDTIAFIVVLLLFMINILISKVYRVNPNTKIGKNSIENIYYSTPVTVFRKTLQILMPIFIAIFMMIFLVNIDPESNIRVVNNELQTNFSLYLTLKNSVLYLKNIFKPSSGGNIMGIVLNSSFKSLILMLSALALSTITGIGRGLYEGYRLKRKNLRSLGTLVVFSIPDVLIVLLGLLFYVLIAQNVSFLNVIILRQFVLPLITLSILPSIYIARITYITIQDEIKLDYIRNARAKGLSRKKIFTTEILPAVAFKIVDTMPSIITMLFSNMIIVEYLFNYLGILNYLIYFYNRQNVDGFLTLAITLGLIYILLTWGVQSVARFMNPLKRKVEK
ncbi:MAG: ABC transporter permease subunit [Clostridiales bacterium]|nr:ABC transporter permease subunit [Clostridiales bacterium]